jgi:aminoglycoside phosphotransferase family enzyme/predicted kinase
MNCRAEVAEFLAQPESYPEAPSSVERIETHISWVFLTDHFAYKLKKPVAYDFLDFRTPELRRAACEEEVRLNRRLAADIYLGVLPITRDADGRLALDGTGEAIDWVVKMKRLAAANALDRLIVAGRAKAEDAARLADRLAEFYRGLPPLAIEPDEYRRQITHHVRANRKALLQFAGEHLQSLAQSVHGAQLQFLALAAERFDERVLRGRIVDGHGDLRPEHVYFLPEPVVLDCIEFNSEYRRIDVLDELGFLTMECDRLGAGEFGESVLRRCAAALQDQAPAKLLAFYKTYRACVRAKVAALRAVQQGDKRQDAIGEALAYLQLAHREAAPLLSPLVLLVRGTSGSGKSTIAAALTESFGAVWISTDAVRRHMIKDGAFTGDGTARYLPENRAAVYERLFRGAEEHLRDAQSVVLDGTFLTADLCRRVAAIARSHRAQLLAVNCHCPEEVARRRIAQRLAAGGSSSEAHPELVAEQRRAQEPLPEGVVHCLIDTTDETSAAVETVVRSLRDLLARF